MNADSWTEKPYTRWKVALIGPSGAGKSTCLRYLSSNANAVEMDQVFGIDPSPPVEEALQWMVDAEEPAVVVGVHRELLRQIANMRETGVGQAMFGKLRFVYLYVSKQRLGERLQQQVNHEERSESNMSSALNNFEELDCLCRKIADHVLDTSDKSIEEVCKELSYLQVSG